MELTTVKSVDRIATAWTTDENQNHDELLAGRLAADTPFSRDVRDDITVQVTFFDCLGV